MYVVNVALQAMRQNLCCKTNNGIVNPASQAGGLKNDMMHGLHDLGHFDNLLGNTFKMFICQYMKQHPALKKMLITQL